MALACNIQAISAAQRPRFNTLAKRLRAAAKDFHELPDGYSYLLVQDGITLPEVAEWISMERLCCPFLTFQLEVTSATSRLALRGPEGAKAILREEFHDG